MTTKELRQVLEWADEGRLQTCSINTNNEWLDVVYNVDFNGTIGSQESFSIYRCKPAEPTLRQWKPEEVPVGAVVKMTSQRCLIIAVNCNDKVVMADSTKNEVYGYPIDMLIGSAYSLDHGKTWLPCGVLE